MAVLRDFSPLKIWLRFLAFAPAVILALVALLNEARISQNETLRRLSLSAQTHATIFNDHLEHLITLTEFCATSPHLVERLDLTTLLSECGRSAELLNAWIVVHELGDINRQLLNSRAEDQSSLPSHNPSDEFPEIVEAIEASRASGQIVVANVFQGPVASIPVITTVLLTQDASGRTVVVSAAMDAVNVSNFLEDSVDPPMVVTILDASHRVAATSTRIEGFMLREAPQWARIRWETLSEARATARVGVNLSDGVWDRVARTVETAPGWVVATAVPNRSIFGPDTQIIRPVSISLFGVMLTWLSLAMLRREEAQRNRIVAINRERDIAERANEEKTRAITSIAHDVRNALLSILGSFDLADQGARPADLPSGRKTYGSALRSVQNQLQHLEDVLDWSKSDKQLPVAKLTPGDIRGTVRDVVEAFKGPADAKGLELTYKVSKTVPMVVNVDRSRLQRTLSNLIENSIKYTDVGSVTLEVIAERQQEEKAKVTFSVSDTGAGIPADKIQLIFKDYGRLPEHEQERYDGIGLGLSICSMLLKTMGTTLNLDSKVGAGSKFFFTLNLTVVLTNTVTPDHRGILYGKHIVFAEDNAIIRKLTTDRLSMEGATVSEARDGAEAVVIAEKMHDQGRRVDLVLLDLEMPGLSGVGVIKEVRLKGLLGDCPIFLLTSHPAGKMTQAATDAGAEAIFTKPVQPVALAGKLQSLLCEGTFQRNDPDEMKTALCASPVLDEDMFNKVLIATGDSALQSLIPKIEDGMRIALAGIRSAVKDGNFENAYKIIHKEKGLCQALGCIRLAQSLTDLEEGLSRLGIAETNKTLGGIAELVDSTLEAIRAKVTDQKAL